MHRIRYQRNQTIYVCICWFGIYLALCTMKFIVWMSGYNRTDNGTEMTKVSSRLSHKRKQRSICLWSISFNRYLSGDSIFILQSLKTSKMRKLAQKSKFRKPKFLGSDICAVQFIVCSLYNQVTAFGLSSSIWRHLLILQRSFWLNTV